MAGEGEQPVALVTGAARRVGAAIARHLAAHGTTVAVHYHHSRELADSLVDEIRRAGGRAQGFAADLTSADSGARLVEEVQRQLGDLDLLVHSAAGFERQAFGSVDPDAWDRMLSLNTRTPFFMSQQAAPGLRRTRGSIVFVTCSSATTPFRGYAPYVVSKGATAHMMRTLAVELAPDIRVNAVAPGTVLPPDDMSDDQLSRIRDRIPLHRFGCAQDIAEAVAFLANASFVTGHELLVDGGRALASR